MPVVHRLQLKFSLAYLIEAPAGLILVDAGCPGEERSIQRAIERLQPARLQIIFITHSHFDHYGSAAALRRLTGAPVAIHAADAPAMALGQTPVASARSWGRIGLAALHAFQPVLRAPATPADLRLEDGASLGELGLRTQVLHTPGHTPGSSCLIVEGQLAFAGDLVSTSDGSSAQRYFAVDWGQIPGSLARLKSVLPEQTYPGHGRRTLDAPGLQALPPPRA